MIILLVGYSFLFVLLAHQLMTAYERHTFTVRRTHGKRCIYVRSRKTGRVVMQTRNLWDILGLGI